MSRKGYMLTWDLSFSLASTYSEDHHFLARLSSRTPRINRMVTKATCTRSIMPTSPHIASPPMSEAELNSLFYTSIPGIDRPLQPPYPGITGIECLAISSNSLRLGLIFLRCTSPSMPVNLGFLGALPQRQTLSVAGLQEVWELSSTPDLKRWHSLPNRSLESY